MQCKRCGARLQQGMLICPECGARQGRSPESVRCASCHGRVPVGLTVCPHCGRTVRPAGPRWFRWVLLVVALVLVALWGMGRLPVERVRREIIDTRDRLSGLVQVLDLPTPTPVRVAAALRTATPMVFPTIVATQTLAVTLSGTEGADQPVAQAITATLAMTSTSAITPTVSLTLTVAGTPPATQPAPTATLTATAASTGSSTSAPAAKGSPTPPTARDSTPIPAVTSTAGVTYVVKAGDTLAGIGAQFGIPWQDIAVANNIGAATGLQIGQRLAIPVAGAPPKPTAAPRPNATPTPSAAAPTPLPAVSAPVLENPGDGTRADGDKTEIELRWRPVPNMPSGAQYQVTVEWVEGGQKNNYVWYTTSAAQRLPTWLWGRADQPTRRYNWFVTVVQVGTDGKGGERVVALTPPSAVRWFEWQ